MSRLLLRVSVSLCFLTLCAVRAGFAQNAPAANSGAEEESVRQAAIQFVEAYNAHNAKALAGLFGPQARMEDEDGEVIEGRQAIEQAYAEEFAESPKTSISLDVGSLKFLTPDVAVEEGAVEIFPDGETLTARSHYLAVHLKKDGAWRIISSRSVAREVISNYDRLRELEFLIGEWIDEGNDSVVEYTARWDDNKSYLLSEFQVIEDGEITMKGSQRIGWDPQAKTIRSWVFDSNGGFGEGLWQFVDGAWQARATGVSADGQSSTATRTYTQIDHDHIVVGTRDRIVDGEKLPDLEITLTRRPPEAAVTTAE
ncbi:MAG: SgcJ/EcaC family oxidoreductase [Planctomycetaceae bacterium]